MVWFLCPTAPDTIRDKRFTQKQQQEDINVTDLGERRY